MADKPKYRVLKGINYPPGNKRAEIGDVVDDLADYIIRNFLHQGAIEEVSEKPETRK